MLDIFSVNSDFKNSNTNTDTAEQPRMTIHDSISIGVKLSENLFWDSQNIYCINVGQHSNNHTLNPRGGLYRFIKTDVSRGTLAEVTGTWLASTSPLESG